MFVDLPPGEHADEVTATLLRDGGEVPVELIGDGDTLRLTVPADRRDGPATTVRLHFS
jgi:alpha-L-fucosidase